MGRAVAQRARLAQSPPQKTKATNQEVDIGEEETGHPQEETSYPQGCKETFAHYKKQCFQRRLKKLIEGPIQAQINWKRKQKENRCLQLLWAAEWRVKLCIGFLPNLALSIHKNAQQVLGDMSPGCYLLKAANTAFHDPTKQEITASSCKLPSWPRPQIHPHPLPLLSQFQSGTISCLD